MILSKQKLIIDINPDYIINLAAITDVELCESNKKLAYSIMQNCHLFCLK